MTVPRRALLVIDVQHEYLDGALPVVFPPVGEALAAIGAAVEAARRGGLPVVLVRHDDGDEAEAFATGSAGASLIAPLAESGADAVIVKHAVSSFVGTGLADLLAELRVDTVSLTGFLTHVCIESTARDAADRGLTVEVLSDATGTIDVAGADARTVQSTTLAVLGSAFAAVTTVTDWADAVASGDALPAPDLLADARAAVAR